MARISRPHQGQGPLVGLLAAFLLVLALPGSALAAADQPNWKYFAKHPRLDGESDDRRLIGCYATGSSVAGPCERNERPPAAAPWDEAGGGSTFTTVGPNADTSLSTDSPMAPAGPDPVRPMSVTREYVWPFTNQWRSARCNPANFAGGPSGTGGTDTNDANAAVVSLFANHNRLHDWSFALGFTPTRFNMEGLDKIVGHAQAGARAGGATFAARDAAARATPADGTSPHSTQYLWQPIASAYYPHCADADFDSSLIAHEYAHAIVNRMAGTAVTGLSGSADGQSHALGEGFADLIAVEYLLEHGYAPADDEDPFTVGAYVTGSKTRGIRNHSMASSPLNYSDVQGYDRSGRESPHDDGEIWAAVNYDIRQALVAKYDGAFPSGNAGLQDSCARGTTAVSLCPGNRRWAQLLFDSLFELPANASMLQARDALLNADQARFGGSNATELWTAFARRGMGELATSAGADDASPVPSFESPLRSDESQLTFAPRADAPGAPGVKAELYVGDYEAGATPVADTDPGTARGATVRLVPGTYSFVARSDGYGAHRFQRTIPPSSSVALDVSLPVNRASAAMGATASGEGAGHGGLIDDTEGTNWQVTGRGAGVAGTQVTVALAGGAHIVDRVNVSAMVNGRDDGAEQEASDHQNRFTALRRFELRTCTASAANSCAGADGYSTIFTSAPDAFPGGAPRPVAPDLTLRAFDVPDTSASHVRLVVLDNQCTGLPLFNDDSLDTDDDPSTGSHSDCTIGNAVIGRTDQAVRAAELQVFSRAPDVVLDPGGGAPPAITPDPKPAVTSLKLSTRRFHIGTKLPRFAAATGTTIRFRLSEAASVTLAFGRATAGRKVGKTCRKATRALRTRPKCTRYAAAGSLKAAGRNGANSVRFQGRLTRKRYLKAGTYRLTVTATDSAGQKSVPRSATFRLLARKRPRR